ncbi:MAG: translation initiation factor IF-2 [Saprospiraceae bacterium]
MAKRLIKIAKELNVGTSTIVDHLTGKGFDIENKPTAKVTDAMYGELLKEFHSSLSVKEKADSLVIGTRPNGSNITSDEETAATSTTTTPANKPKEREQVKISFAPNPPKKVSFAPKPKVVVEKEVVAPKVEPEVIPEPTPEPPKQPKVETPPPPPVVEVPKVTEAPEVKETPVAPVIAEKKEEEPQNRNAPKLKVIGKIDLDAQKRKPANRKQKPRRERSPQNKSKQSAGRPNAPVDTPKGKPAIIKNKTTPQPSSSPSTNNDSAKENQQPAKPQRDRPAPSASSESKPTTSKDTSEPKRENKVIRADAPELRGLKVVDKIDLDKFKRKKKKKAEPASDKDKSKEEGSGGTRRRRRKRRTVSTTNFTQPSSGGGGNRTSGGGGGSRTAGGSGGGNRSGGNRSGGNRRNDRNSRNSGRRDEPKEVSQKEIEDKIKATMARLQGGGKKKRQKIRRVNRDRMREKQEMREMENKTETLQVTEFISVSELASLMSVSVTQVITTCMNLGAIVSINQRLDAEIIELVAEEFGHEVEFISAEEEVEEEEEIVDAPEDLQPRAPIITVMGHVDHGKTSLLDYIRNAKVADGEAGGITQHIGAYEVTVGEEGEEKRITFLDTPGHEAFTAMRARGAKVTDIAIIIIAADDSIMPQTKEAISHAQAAGVPIVFAINKIDKPGAQPERIKQELANMNFLVEEWGGKYQSQDISAKTGENIDELLEKVVLEADILELQANPDRAAIGAVLEASLDRGRGYVTKMLVQTGSLEIGDPIVAGEHSGKVKAMFNERGKRIKHAGPSKPVLVLGLSGAPQAGERIKEVDTEQEARSIASRRAQIAREQANRANKRISLDEIGRRLALGNFKELNLIVKGDFDGSVEALSDSLIKQSIETVQVNVIHKAVGQIIESDVLLASASDAIIVGFQVRPSLGARKLAEREGVEIKSYSIIYEAIDEIRTAIEGLLEPTKEKRVTGTVEVREVYKISKVGTIAGCYVQDGKISRNSYIEVIRNGIVVFPTKEGVMGEISSLKRFKDDVKEVKSGFECGISLKNFNDIRMGDSIESYEIIEVKQTLEKQR